jgi:chromosome segregation ATPase
MAKRTFEIGLNQVNGFSINVTRVTSAYYNSDNSRIAAHYFGDITTPDGDIIEMGDSGKTVEQIKRIVGLSSTMNYNRGSNGSSKMAKLLKLKSQLEQLGIPTTEVDAQITEEQEQIDARNRERNQNSARAKEIKKQIKLLKQTIESMQQLGMFSTDLNQKLEILQEELNNL